MVRAKEMEPPRDVDFSCVAKGRILIAFPVILSISITALGMLAVGFEKKIYSLYRKIESIKGCGVRV